MPIVERRGDGPRTFLLVHGLPGDATQMAPIVAPLAEHGAVAVVELPDSGRAPEDPSLDPDESVAHVRAIVESLAPSRVTLVGLSFGGWLAARLASHDPPANLDRIVVLGGFARLSDEHRARFEGLASEIEAGRLTRGDLVSLAGSLWFPTHAPEGAVDHVRALIESLSIERAARAVRRAGACARSDRGVDRYDVEAVLLHARGDVSIPLALGEELASRGARATLRVLETDSHCLTWSHPSECVAAIVEAVA